VQFSSPFHRGTGIALFLVVGKLKVTEAIFYLLFVSCIAGVSWVVMGTVAGVRLRRKSLRIEQGLAEYLRERANQKKN
jgi:hypothetical protein